MSRHFFFAPVCLFAFACQSAPTPTPRQVERDPLRDVLAVPAAHDGTSNISEANRQKVDALVLMSFTAPEPATRAAGVFATADQRLAPLANALAAIDQSISVCATNLANAETTAYKGSRAVSGPDGKPHFCLNAEQGSLENTGRQLDVAISGEGFFKVKLFDSGGEGYAYTRNGNLFINKDGDLTLGMGDGYRLVPPITVPKGATDLSISQDGMIEVVRAQSNTKVRIGRLQLVRFANPEGLNVIGGSLFSATESSGAPVDYLPCQDGAGQTLQGFLEGSNVDPTKERLRIRYLQNWRDTILRAVDDAK